MKKGRIIQKFWQIYSADPAGSPARNNEHFSVRSQTAFNN